MLVESEGDVVVLPATTRYESPGGGTETSTERRIIFSPEIPGRRIGSARAEWQVFGEVMARVRPDRANQIRFDSATAIRQEIASTIPLYAGIETLRKKGDQVQWGGRTLFADGRFATPDGQAHFAAVTPRDVRPRPTGRVRPSTGSGRAFEGPGVWFTVSTRRGKQFNSMVHRDVDPLTGAGRDAVFISREDALRLGLKEGTLVRLRSSNGTFSGRLRLAAIRAGNLEIHWPEGNVLLSAGAIDPDSMEPDYNAQVTLELSA